MKILAIGGAGYVGSACLRWLLGRGHDPIAYDSLLEGNVKAVPDNRLIVADILDRDALVRAMQDHQIDAVMHFAALASVPDSIVQPDTYWRTNVLGTMNILDAMKKTGVRKILFSSTAATYSFDEPMPLTEQSEQIPRTPYGTTKKAAESMILEYSKAFGFGHVILRYFNAAGADPGGRYGEDRRHEAHLIPLIFKAALGQRPAIEVCGDDWETRDGTCVRDYVHTSDLAHAHQLALEALAPGEAHVYNVGSGTGTTVMEVIKACEKAVGTPIPYCVVPRRPGDPPVLIASPEKLIRDFGWMPRWSSIDQIVETAWHWHKNHHGGYA